MTLNIEICGHVCTYSLTIMDILLCIHVFVLKYATKCKNIHFVLNQIIAITMHLIYLMHKILLIKRKHFGIVLTLANVKSKNIQIKHLKCTTGVLSMLFILIFQ